MTILWAQDPASRVPGRPLVTRANGINRGFRETQVAFFGPAENEWNLYVDDEPLQRSEADGRALWKWAPGFYAGTVVAELVNPQGSVAASYLLDVSPDPGKVGQELWAGLVEDIRKFDARLLFGTEPASTLVGHEEEEANFNIQCSRLLRFAQSFIDSLAAIRARPHRVLRSFRSLRPARDVRRIDSLTLRTALKNATAIALLDRESELCNASDAERILLDVPVSVDTFDSAANRTLLAVVRSVARRTRKLIEHFEAVVAREQDSATRTPLALRWPRRSSLLSKFQKTLARTINVEPLKSVTRPEVTAAGLTSIAAHPLYAKAQQLAWRILRFGQSGISDEETTWMSPTWEVYERWCFVELANRLREALPDMTWRQRGDPLQGPILEGTQGTRRVVLRAQQTFSYKTKPSADTGFHSVSMELRPDLVLTVEHEKSAEWFVLDAKYRQGRSNVLDAMRTSHVYHDALRRFGKPPKASLLLIPARAEDASWLHDEHFRETHGVGTIALIRGNSAGEDLVAELLAA